MPEADLVAARALGAAAMLAAAGMPLYLLTLRQTLSGKSRTVVAALALVAAAASVWWAAASIAAMAAMPVSALDWPIASAVLSATPLGKVLAVRLLALALLVLFAAVSGRPALHTLAGVLALSTSAWTGHAGAGEGALGTAQRVADVIHLGAASLWLGALMLLLAALLPGKPKEEAARRLAGFAATGTLVVTLLTLTGVFNAYAISRPGWSVTSGWSVLLAVKIGLFVAMLAFAGFNRWRLTPALVNGEPGAATHLRLSLALETGCAVAIVVIVAVLGALDPGGAPLSG